MIKASSFLRPQSELQMSLEQPVGGSKGINEPNLCQASEPLPPRKHWLTREQIAEHFQIGARTVSNLMRRKILPYSKTANLVRFELTDCDCAFEKFIIGAQVQSTNGPWDGAPIWKTKSQIAAHLQVSLRTTTNMMHRGILPYVKIGHLVRFDLRETDRRIEQLRSHCVFDRKRNRYPSQITSS